jgi:lambda family phage portal protein
MASSTNIETVKQAVAGAMRPNVFEKIIQRVAPIYAAKRMKARASIAWGQGYIGARFDRNQTKTWFAPHLAADETMLWDLITLRARSRDLMRNAPIARGAVKTVVTNVVGSGLKLQSCPDAQALGITDEQAATLKKTIEREFRLFAETTDCDLNRRQNFYGLQSLAFLSALEGGDSFALLPMVSRTNAVYETCIQLIEAERVANPVGQTDSVTMRAGIEIDAFGTPVAYNIRKQHPFSTAGTIDQGSTRVLAFGKKTGRRNVLHLIEQERPGQSRGVPYLAPVMELLKSLDTYSEAELQAAVISAMFTVFITTPTGEGFLGDADTLNSSPATDGVKSALGPNDVALGNGSIIDLMPGEKPEFANPSRPNANFDSFVQAVMRQIGIALQIPFEVLIKHFTASYSAARAALLDAWTFFYNRRDWLTSTFCQPVFETWFEEAVAAGRIDAPGFFDDPAIRRAYVKADWIGDAPVSMDPLKDANAAQARLNAKLSSRSEECLQLTGKSWDDVLPQIVQEQKAIAEAGLMPESAPPASSEKAVNPMEKKK